MFWLLLCALLPWTAIAAAPRSEEYAATKRKNATKFFGKSRSNTAKRREIEEAIPTTTASMTVRASVEVEPNGLTKPVEQPEASPAIRVQADVVTDIPLDKQTPGIPVVTPEDGTKTPVPKIIHFMYKEDLDQPGVKWPNPVWHAAFTSWQRYFPRPEYMYRFWTDAAIDRFFRDSCSEHYMLFTTYTKEIFRSDLSRYCILKEIGGIYTDLDYEPRANFYNDLTPGKVSLIGSAYDGEVFQNALMASPAGPRFTDYWKGLLDLAEVKRQFNEGPVEATGPKLLDNFPMNEDPHMVNKLPCKDFQRKIHVDAGAIKKHCGYLTLEDATKIKGIHWGTVSWNGQEAGVLAGELEGKNTHKDTARLFRLLHPEVPETELK